MVYKKLSEEDKIIIKYLRQKFGYGAKRIMKDHHEKNSGLRNVGYSLKNLMTQVALKGEKDRGDLKVAGLKITSMQSKSKYQAKKINLEHMLRPTRYQKLWIFHVLRSEE